MEHTDILTLHKRCAWTGDTYRLRGSRTASYDINGRNAVILAEKLSGAVDTPSEPQEPVDVNYVVVVNGSNLNVRTGAGTTYQTVGQVSKPQSFRIVSESLGIGANLWGKISASDPIYPNKWIALDFTIKDAMQPQQKPPNGSTYTVKSGDTLSVIARDLNIPLSVLIELNGIENPDRIFVGQVLKIPQQ